MKASAMLLLIFIHFGERFTAKEYAKKQLQSPKKLARRHAQNLCAMTSLETSLM